MAWLALACMQRQQQQAAFKQMRAEGVFNDEEQRRNERKKSQQQQVRVCVGGRCMFGVDGQIHAIGAAWAMSNDYGQRLVTSHGVCAHAKHRSGRTSSGP